MPTSVVYIEVDTLIDEAYRTIIPRHGNGVIHRISGIGMMTIRVEILVGGMTGTEDGTGTTGTGTEGETGTECIDKKIQDLDTQAAILDRYFMRQRSHCTTD